jgi:hypothetical protein
MYEMLQYHGNANIGGNAFTVVVAGVSTLKAKIRGYFGLICS